MMGLSLGLASAAGAAKKIPITASAEAMKQNADNVFFISFPSITGVMRRTDGFRQRTARGL